MTITTENIRQLRARTGAGIMDVKDALNQADGDEEKAIKLKEPIKQLGVYKVPVRLSPEVESTITVWVVKNSG